MRLKFLNKKGYIVLIGVLIVGAVGLVIVSSLLLLSLGSSQNSLILKKSIQARALADACAEKAILRIKNWPSYSGVEKLKFEEGECQYRVRRLVWQIRIIESSGVVDSTVRKVRVVITKIIPSISIFSWQEVADF